MSTMENRLPAARRRSLLQGWAYRAQTVYVRLMLWLVARLLGAASAVDPTIRSEVRALPGDFAFTMRVRSGKAGMVVGRVGDRLRAADPNRISDPSLVFEFKHISHAFLVLAFLESTSRSFANDRITVDGDIGLAMKVVRCLNRMEVLVLPKFVAARAVKAYPRIDLVEKLTLAMRIYGRMLLDLLGGR